MKDFWTTFFYIVSMIAILVAAYLTTKYIARRGIRAKSHFMSLLDRMSLGADKYIALVEVNGKHLLIGVTNQSIHALGEVDMEDITAEIAQDGPPEENGFSKFCRRLVYIKEAPQKLNRMRAEAKKDGKRDYLGQMDQAIKTRRSNAKGFDGERK